MSASLSCGAAKPAVKTSGESPTIGFDLGPYLQPGETVASVTHVQCIGAEQSGYTKADGSAASGSVATGDVTFGTPAVNSSTTFDTDERTVPVNQGVRVRASAGVDGGNYFLRVRFVTSGGDTRDLVPCILQVRDT